MSEKMATEGAATAIADAAVKRGRFLAKAWHRVTAAVIGISTVGGAIIAIVLWLRPAIALADGITNALPAIRANKQAIEAVDQKHTDAEARIENDAKEREAKIQQSIHQIDVRFASTDATLKDLRDGQNQILQVLLQRPTMQASNGGHR